MNEILLYIKRNKIAFTLLLFFALFQVVGFQIQGAFVWLDPWTDATILLPAVFSFGSLIFGFALLSDESSLGSRLFKVVLCAVGAAGLNIIVTVLTRVLLIPHVYQSNLSDLFQYEFPHIVLSFSRGGSIALFCVLSASFILQQKCPVIRDVGIWGLLTLVSAALFVTGREIPVIFLRSCIFGLAEFIPVVIAILYFQFRLTSNEHWSQKRISSPDSEGCDSNR